MMKNMIRVTLALMFMAVGFGCTSPAYSPAPTLSQYDKYYNYIQPTFADYLQETRTWLTANRSYITSNHEKELSMNMPFEMKPEQQTNKAILLVHGLGDSPYSYSDLAVTLKKQGFYVQSLLLPGHGSKPDDLMLPNYSDWQEIVDHYANLLKKDYDQVWLSGFSTGGNLVTIHAIEQSDIDGLILFSPGFQSRVPFLENFAPLVSLFIDGFSAEEHNIARYTSAPIQGGIAYSESASKLRDLLDENTVTIPTLIAVSEDDSVVDPEAIEELYLEHFDNPHNQFIWYGETPQKYASIQVKTMKLDAFKISTGSHMSPLYAPSNPYYGQHGERRMCMNSMDKDAIARCEQGEEVWFSAWGYEEDGKIHARLTWNPYYTELEESILQVTQSSSIDHETILASHSFFF